MATDRPDFTAVLDQRLARAVEYVDEIEACAVGMGAEPGVATAGAMDAILKATPDDVRDWPDSPVQLLIAFARLGLGYTLQSLCNRDSDEEE